MFNYVLIHRWCPSRNVTDIAAFARPPPPPPIKLPAPRNLHRLSRPHKLHQLHRSREYLAVAAPVSVNQIKLCLFFGLSCLLFDRDSELPRGISRRFYATVGRFIRVSSRGYGRFFFFSFFCFSFSFIFYLIISNTYILKKRKRE